MKSEQEFLKPLTPKFRGEINASIDAQIRELESCQRNAFVNVQLAALSCYKNLFNALPDGYPVPVKKC